MLQRYAGCLQQLRRGSQKTPLLHDSRLHQPGYSQVKPTELDSFCKMSRTARWSCKGFATSSATYGTVICSKPSCLTYECWSVYTVWLARVLRTKGLQRQYQTTARPALMVQTWMTSRTKVMRELRCWLHSSASLLETLRHRRQ